MDQFLAKKSCVLATVFIFLISCGKSESIIEREERLINDYHTQIKKERDRKYLFILQEDASVIYKDRIEINLKESKFGDKVIFLDKDGNVVYQAEIVGNDGGLPKISALNLDNFREYATSLSIDFLQGCDKELIEEFKILR